MPPFVYDEYGNVVPGKTLVADIEVQTDPTFPKASESVPLINVSTNHASVFTVDAVTYANCLVTQLKANKN